MSTPCRGRTGGGLRVARSSHDVERKKRAIFRATPRRNPRAQAEAQPEGTTANTTGDQPSCPLSTRPSWLLHSPRSWVAQSGAGLARRENVIDLEYQRVD